MSPWQAIIRDILGLVIKIAFVVAIVLGLLWFFKQGSVLVDQGKKHGIVGR
ncbi:MAG: hypothetical protein PHS09_00540 [Candidatus Omnitrophica bacterium]|jgi:hypothetical protein|nr:hypothetical protein [Candidatus Omnitrophota bacterium]